MKYVWSFQENVFAMLAAEPEDYNFSNKDLDYWKGYGDEYVPGTNKLIKNIRGLHKKQDVISLVKYLAKQYDEFEENTHPVNKDTIVRTIALGKALIDRDGFVPTNALDAMLAQEG